MRQFPELKHLTWSELEVAILRQWQQENVFNQSLERRKGGPQFTFYEGPPTANGRPGIHHVLSRSLKDAICRYKAMQGFYVPRRAGWDTHGLPVELSVEKALNLTDRAAIENFGIARYNQACRESVLAYKQDWDELTERIGYWVDLQDPYITCTNEYIESVWALLKRIHAKGLLYRGYKVQWYSPGTGTVLSSHEVSLGYKEVADPSVFVKFKVLNQVNTYLLAWTTTPWTLPANAALAVNKDIEYVKIELTTGQQAGEAFILAADCLSVITDEYWVIASYRGQDLQGWRYQPIFTDYTSLPETERAWRVVFADYVTTTDGTGVVHTAPAFGADDYTVGLQEELPLLNPIDEQGYFTDDITLVRGLWFKSADEPIIQYLKSIKALYKKQTIRHNYPHDWRKGTPLMSYPIASWFIRTTAVKDQLVKLNKQINWLPASVGTGRFGNWLENNVDWAISRQRYWGTPLPFWMTEEGDYYEVIGSLAELREKAQQTLPEPEHLDLHRPYIDEFTWTAPDGRTLRRVPEVLDVWFDSGAMPFAQWYYPFANQELFEQNFPADFIAEGLDQTRGWFYTLHAIATLVEEKPAYKNVVVLGLVLDDKGEKMSKSKGNTVEPLPLIQEYGADSVRWYMLSNAQPWDSLRFSVAGVSEVQRRVMNTLRNTYTFFATYANIEGFAYQEAVLPVEQRSLLDQWILSRLATVTHQVEQALEQFNPARAARSLEQLIDELSNWYVRRSRQRFWKEKRQAESLSEQQDITAAYQTLYEVLLCLAQLMAPIAPFISDWLYQALNQVTQKESSTSVHLSDFPKLPDSYLNRSLEDQMELGLTVVRLVLGLRNQHNINVRQPLVRMLLVESEQVNRATLQAIEPIILSEVNVKKIEYVQTTSKFVRHQVKPNFKLLGARLGKKMHLVQQAVGAMEESAIIEYLSQGEMTLMIEGEAYRFTEGELIVTSHGLEGWLVEQANGVTVALDTTIDAALRMEGLTREIINRLQQMRKAAHYELTDRIRVYYHTEPNTVLEQSIRQNKAFIKNETLAVELLAVDKVRQGDKMAEFAFVEGKLSLAIERVCKTEK